MKLARGLVFIISRFLTVNSISSRLLYNWKCFFDRLVVQGQNDKGSWRSGYGGHAAAN